MDRILNGQTEPKNRIAQNTYPVWGIVVVMGLLFLSPFLSSYPAYVAFVICLYRMIRYDAKVFAVDYCVLAPMTQIFCAHSGMSLLLYLVLLAAVWYLIRGGIRNSANYILLIILMNYLLARMQLNVTQFLLCFGHLCMICVIVPKQDRKSAALATKLFCISLLISSVYALLVRNTWQLRAIIGAESEAIYSTGIMRFRGLLADPNYYMTFLVIGMVLLAKLKQSNEISTKYFMVGILCIIVLGIMTYSKSFVVMLALLVCIYVFWQFYNRKYLLGFLLLLGIVGCVHWVITSDSPFATVLARFSGNNLNKVTTGRTGLMVLYLKEVVSDYGSILFGKGLNDPGLAMDPHNLYIELMYYIGLIGLILYLTFFGTLVVEIQKTVGRNNSLNRVSNNTILIAVLIMFFSLHGMYQMIFYADIFLLMICMWIIPVQRENVDLSVSVL